MRCPFRKVCWVLFILSIVLVSVNAFAQLQLRTGNLAGTVVTNQGDKLPGVFVTLSSRVGYSQFMNTDAAGKFKFYGIPIGIYTAKAELEGFSTVAHHNIMITSDMVTTIQIVLQPTAGNEQHHPSGR